MLFSSMFTYLVGSIPTGYWFSKYCFGINITEHGSGNIGATNTARILGKKYFFLIMTLDALKAALALLLIKENLILGSVMLLIGNAYSVFMNFRGGKGVATTLGILSVIAPYQIPILFAITWIITLVATKRAYIASMLSVALITLAYWYLGSNMSLQVFLCFLNVWIAFRHKSNFIFPQSPQVGL